MSDITIDLSRRDILQKLKRGIKSRKRRTKPITKLNLQCLSSEFWVFEGATFSDADLQDIFHLLGLAFPCLKEIQITVFELPLPVKALQALLSQTKDSLERIDMCDVILKGSQDEFEAWSATLQGHKVLKQVHLDWCKPLSGSLDPVLEGLCNVTTLSQVKLGGSVLSVDFLRVLCSKQSLKRLSLPNDALKDDGITAMAEALESNSHIREFSGRLSGLDTATGKRFANVLRVNTTLKSLELRIGDNDWNKYGSAFTDALEANSTLTNVTLFIDGDATEIVPTAKLLVGAIEKHPSLNSMQIGLRGLFKEDALQKAFAGPITCMLQNSNHLLEEIHIEGMNIPPEAALYLKANRAGRRNLVNNVHAHELWADALINERDDVALSYLLLSMNPSFIC